MTDGGAIGRENVGMSNHNRREIRRHLKSKVSLAMTINQGLGGPNPTPKGLGDGQPVNIPAPTHIILKNDAVKILVRVIGFLSRVCGSFKNQIARKSFSGVIYACRPYCKPTQVGWCECTKVNG